jgi:hypothetical protein
MIVEGVQTGTFVSSSAFSFSASNPKPPASNPPAKRPFFELSAFFGFHLTSFPAYSPFRIPTSIYSPFRIQYSLSSVISPLYSLLWLLSSDIWHLSPGNGYAAGGTHETFPIKSTTKLLTLHVVASFGSPSRCCKVVNPDEGQIFFCHFVWLKMLDKPNAGWYSLPLIHSYHIEFIGKFTVSRLLL